MIPWSFETWRSNRTHTGEDSDGGVAFDVEGEGKWADSKDCIQSVEALSEKLRGTRLQLVQICFLIGRILMRIGNQNGLPASFSDPPNAPVGVSEAA